MNKKKKKKLKPGVNDEGFGNEPFILEKNLYPLKDIDEEEQREDTSERSQNLNEEETNNFYEQCNDEEKFNKYVAKIENARVEKFLKDIKVGDIVYGKLDGEEVKVLEMPSDKIGTVKVLTRYGVRDYFPAVLVTIKKGNFCADHLFKGKRAKGTAEAFQLIAEEKGFRTDIVKKGRCYLLKIFGNSQEEVDDFVTYRIRNDLFIL